MPTVRTTCPSCDVVVIDAGDITLRRPAGSARAECVFLCPDCLDPVVQPIPDKMVPVLIGAGCEVADWESDHPSAAGRITETEIAAFVVELEREDWMAELLDH